MTEKATVAGEEEKKIRVFLKLNRRNSGDRGITASGETKDRGKNER